MLQRRIASGIAVCALLAGLVPAARAEGSALPPRALAEQRVLSVLGRDWNPRRIPELVDPRTRLPRDNVQAVCRVRRGQHMDPARYVCVVRPEGSKRVRLYLTYRLLPGGGFRVHWLDLRR